MLGMQHLWSAYCIPSIWSSCYMPSIYGTPTVYLALSVGAGREEKVGIFREETSLGGENLEDDTERIVGCKQILL